MEARTVVPPAKIPFGLIFASFMVRPLPDSAPRALAADRRRAAQVSMMLGSCCFNYLGQLKWRAEAMMSLVLGVGIVAMAIVLLTSNAYVCLFAFCSFEATCGVYFPAMGMLRGEYLPNDTRSTIMNLARVRARAAHRPPARPRGPRRLSRRARVTAGAAERHRLHHADLRRRALAGRGVQPDHGVAHARARDAEEPAAARRRRLGAVAGLAAAAPPLGWRGSLLRVESRTKCCGRLQALCAPRNHSYGRERAERPRASRRAHTPYQ